MQHYEYLSVYVNSKGYYQAANGSWIEMNELGALGWELVAVVNESQELVAFFKRIRINRSEKA